VVNLVQDDLDGWVRAGGSLRGTAGSFTLSAGPDGNGGLLTLPGRGLAYEVNTEMNGRVLMVERRLSDKQCFSPEVSGMRKLADAAPSTSEAPPLLSSRPNAPAVVYLDFDGETVTDPGWNNGSTIVAPPTPLSAAQITEIYNRVKEDYAAFDIDITTSLARYNAVAPNRRTRCIMTTNDAAAPGAGGVAYVGAFSAAGGGSLSSTVPCWVFNAGVVGVAEAISHEVGHTLGLRHDGRTSPAEGYYAGAGTGATGWAPIMGVGYSQKLVQWSKGEYLNANNKEDDLAIITRSQNGVSYVADEAGNDAASAAALTINAGTINQTGLITGNGDVDFFKFTTTGGNITITAPQDTVSPNLDIVLELRKADNTLVTASGSTTNPANPAAELGANLTATLASGTYTLKVAGTGKGNVLSDGYSSYGSIGVYTLLGTLAGNATTPSITSAAQASGKVGEAFSYQVTATNSPTTFAATSTLPNGLTFNTTSGILSGTPTAAGTFSVQLTASNGSGTGSAFTLTLAIQAATALLADAIDLPGATVTTTGNAGWKSQTGVTFDAVDAAQSGAITDNQSSSMKLTVTGPKLLSFRWRVDSEARTDTLSLLIDSAVVETISGTTTWALRSFRIPAGTHLVEWRYAKDNSLSVGADAGYVDTVSLTTPDVQRLEGNLAFGSVNVGSSSTRAFVISNDGSSALNVAGITYPNGFSGDYASGVIAAGASQSVTVTFTPTGALSYSGNVTVNSNAGSGATTLPITGEGAQSLTTLVSGQAVTGLGGQAASGRLFKILVPNGSAKLEVVSSGGQGDADLYIKQGSAPTTSMFTQSSQGPSTNESISRLTPAGGDWFVLVYGYRDYASVSLTATVTAPPSSFVIAASSGGHGTVSGAGTFQQGRTVDLRATPDAGYGFVSWTEGGVVVSNTSTYSFVVTKARSLVANFSAVIPLTNNVTLRNLMGATDGEVTYRITVPVNTRRLIITSTGGSGDVDLYLKQGSAPSGTDFGYRSAGSTNAETLSIANPAAGDWYLLARGRTAYSAVSLNAVLTPKTTAEIATETPNGTALERMIGNYNGLFGDGASRLLGRLQISLSAKRAFSGVAVLDGVSYNLKGQLDTDGKWNGFIKVRRVPDPIPVSLAADLADQITIKGSIGWDGIQYEALAILQAAGAPNEVGTYSVQLIPNADETGDPLPATIGTGVLTVRKNATATMVATLGDGTRISVSGFVSMDGNLALYVPLYRNTGAIGGWWSFDSWKDRQVVKGSLRWFKAAGDTTTNSAGFNGLVTAEGTLVGP